MLSFLQCCRLNPQSFMHAKQSRLPIELQPQTSLMWLAEIKSYRCDSCLKAHCVFTELHWCKVLNSSYLSLSSYCLPKVLVLCYSYSTTNIGSWSGKQTFLNQVTQMQDHMLVVMLLHICNTSQRGEAMAKPEITYNWRDVFILMLSSCINMKTPSPPTIYSLVPERAETPRMATGGRFHMHSAALLLFLFSSTSSQRMLMVSVGRTCQGHFITSSSSFLPKTAEECSPKMNNIAGKALSPSENRDAARDTLVELHLTKY